MLDIIKTNMLVVDKEKRWEINSVCTAIHSILPDKKNQSPVPSPTLPSPTKRGNPFDQVNTRFASTDSKNTTTVAGGSAMDKPGSGDEGLAHKDKSRETGPVSNDNQGQERGVDGDSDVCFDSLLTPLQEKGADQPLGIEDDGYDAHTPTRTARTNMEDLRQGQSAVIDAAVTTGLIERERNDKVGLWVDGIRTPGEGVTPNMPRSLMSIPSRELFVEEHARSPEADHDPLDAPPHLPGLMATQGSARGLSPGKLYLEGEVPFPVVGKQQESADVSQPLDKQPEIAEYRLSAPLPSTGPEGEIVEDSRVHEVTESGGGFRRIFHRLKQVFKDHMAKLRNWVKRRRGRL